MNQIFPKETASFLLDGKSGVLEVMTTFPKQIASTVVLIICHPHPLYQGTMHNKVVSTVARAGDHLGMPTVRFNFRGVGKSQGSYGAVTGEIEDLQEILRWVKQALPQYAIALAGFSFGAYISATVANENTPIFLISIAPPVNHYDFMSLTKIACPWLIIQGEQDEIVPCAKVQQFVSNTSVSIKLEVMSKAGHFFHGQLIQLREILESYFKHINTILS